MKKKVASGTKPSNYILPTAHCLLRTAYCALPTAYCLLHTAYCILPTAYCLLPTFLFLFFFVTSAQSQSDPYLDSLVKVIDTATGTHKIDLIIQSVDYRRDVLNTVSDREYVELSGEVYRLAQGLNYKRGIAKAYILKGLAYSSLRNPDSARIYFNKALDLFLEMNDSVFIAKSYRFLGMDQYGYENYTLAIEYLDDALKFAVHGKSYDDQIYVYGYLADMCNMQGKFEKEENYYQSMLNILKENNVNPSQALISLARYYIYHGNYKESIRYSLMADSAIGLLADKDVPEKKDRLMMQGKMKGMVARAYRLWGYYDSAMTWHRKAIAEMEQSPLRLDVDIPNQWEGIGYVYTQKGKYDSARYYFQNSTNDREAKNDFLGAGEGLDGLGYLSWQIGDEESAVKYYLEAIDMKSKARQSNVPHRKASYNELLSVSYLRLGQAYASWGIPESARQNLEKADSLCKLIGFRKGKGDAMIEMGKLYGETGTVDSAQVLMMRALNIFVEIDYKPGQAEVLLALGDIYYHENEFEKALQYYVQSERVIREAENPSTLADVLICKGQVLSELKEFEEAQQYLQDAIILTDKFHFYRRSMKAHKALADLFEKSGKPALAVDYYARYLAMRDSINIQKTFFLLNDLQSKRQAETDMHRKDMLEKENNIKALTLERSNSVLIGVFGLAMMLILVSVMILRTIRLKEAQKEMLLKSKLFHSRMNPEFINYSVSNMKSLILKSDTLQASDYITHFSRLMQSVLEGSRYELIPLRKGISMLRNYFELMRIGNPGSFEYEMIIDDSMDQDEILVPSFLDSVALPGFKAEEGQRSIKLKISNPGEVLDICVEAYGTADRHPGISTRENEALKVIPETLAEMEKKAAMKLKFNINDIFGENGTPCGKRIEFTVPAVYA